MRILWLTWIDPTPKSDGQRVYSSNLIHAAAGAGARLDVLCLADRGSPRDFGSVHGNVRWWPVPDEPKSALGSLTSRLPNFAYRFSTRAVRDALDMVACRARWDVVVLDGLSAGWALPQLRAFGWRNGRAPRLVYVAHNHEESTRAAVARNFAGSGPKRLILARDAAKAGRLERAVAADVDLVTAITRDDADRFAAQWPGKPVVVLPPGYDGPRRPDRLITRRTPRRAVLFGSFHWIAKRMNLEEFVAVADPLFADNGIALDVVGRGGEECLGGVRKGLRATRITGAVPEAQPYFDEARIAVVAERSGGGFKLKLLDYVFNGLPVAALSGTEAGMPLAPPNTMLSFEHMGDLARGIVANIDDLDRLNAIQRGAYQACERAFDWRSRGEALLAGAMAA